MKLPAVILLSILAYATGELEYLKFRIHSFYDTQNQTWISIKQDGHKIFAEVNVQEEITGDDWMMDYTIKTDGKLSSNNVVKFCDAKTIQDKNIIELYTKTLGVEERNCPIQAQIVAYPERNIEGYLELENYNKDQNVNVEMLLIRDDRLVLQLTLTT